MTKKVGLFHGSPAQMMKSLTSGKDGGHDKVKVIVATVNIGAAG